MAHEVVYEVRRRYLVESLVRRTNSWEVRAAFHEKSDAIKHAKHLSSRSQADYRVVDSGVGDDDD